MATNIGNQIVTVKWSDTVSSEVANRIANNVRPVGIYSGGWLTKVNNNTVSISPLLCEIKDISGVYQVNVTTTESVLVPNSDNLLQITPSRNVVVLRWTRTSNANTEYLEFKAIALNAILVNDVVVGVGVYSGSVLQDSFDYTLRTCPNIMDLYLKVEPSFYNPLKVQVRKGVVNYSKGPIQINDGTQSTNTITVPSTGTLVQLVQIDQSGIISINTENTENLQNGKITLARLIVLSGTTSVSQVTIQDTRNFIYNTSPSVSLAGVQTITGAKTFNANTTFNNVTSNGLMYTAGGLQIENRTTDPVSPETGRIWLRTDL